MSVTLLFSYVMEPNTLDVIAAFAFMISWCVEDRYVSNINDVNSSTNFTVYWSLGPTHVFNSTKMNFSFDFMNKLVFGRPTRFQQLVSWLVGWLVGWLTRFQQ